MGGRSLPPTPTIRRSLSISRTASSANLVGYLAQPTPGAQNRVALAQIGPAILSVTDNPPAPAPGQNLTITAEVAPTLAPIRSVKLFCRVNYTPEARGLSSGGIAMLDDGKGADAAARDGVYTAVIPSQYYVRGDMVRWYVKAEDTAGHTSRDPLFPLSRQLAGILRDGRPESGDRQRLADPLLVHRRTRRRRAPAPGPAARCSSTGSSTTTSSSVAAAGRRSAPRPRSSCSTTARSSVSPTTTTGSRSSTSIRTAPTPPICARRWPLRRSARRAAPRPCPS